MRVFFEVIFDLVYLVSIIWIGITMIRGAKTANSKNFGIMAVVLGAGDAFHLVPRMIALLSGLGMEHYAVPLGIGKLVTSITMTFFYILLYGIYKKRYQHEDKKIDLIIYAMALIRIVLCLFPQNMWTTYRQPILWGVLRNIPFSIMGGVVVWLFYKAQKERNDKAYKYMWLTIVLSFGFYIPVVLFSGLNETIGLLMIPKTMAYVWTVLIGYLDFRKNG